MLHRPVRVMIGTIEELHSCRRRDPEIGDEPAQHAGFVFIAPGAQFPAAFAADRQDLKEKGGSIPCPRCKPAIGCPLSGLRHQTGSRFFFFFGWIKGGTFDRSASQKTGG